MVQRVALISGFYTGKVWRPLSYDAVMTKVINEGLLRMIENTCKSHISHFLTTLCFVVSEKAWCFPVENCTSVVFQCGACTCNFLTALSFCSFFSSFPFFSQLSLLFI